MCRIRFGVLIAQATETSRVLAHQTCCEDGHKVQLRVALIGFLDNSPCRNCVQNGASYRTTALLSLPFRMLISDNRACPDMSQQVWCANVLTDRTKIASVSRRSTDAIS
jgi:hypothetical protein